MSYAHKIAMGLYDRCVTGLRLTPVSTKAVDAAAVLFESIRPLPEPAAGQPDARPPYHGLPGQVIIDAAQLATEDGEPLLPSVAAETIVVDYADPPVMPTRTSGLLDRKVCMSNGVGIISGCSG